MTFGRVLSRLGKVQTSLPLHSLLQNLADCKKSRILTRGCPRILIRCCTPVALSVCVCVCVCVIEISGIAKYSALNNLIPHTFFILSLGFGNKDTKIYRNRQKKTCTNLDSVPNSCIYFVCVRYQPFGLVGIMNH